MIISKINIKPKIILSVLAFTFIPILWFSGNSYATTLSQNGAIGLQGEIPSNPPTRGATIAVPSNGASFTSLPITVSGTCPSGLLIKVFSNNIFIGSAICTGGSYSVQTDLFSGQNTLTAIDYDALNQAGPTSNDVNVTYSNVLVSQYGTQLTLSSTYGELGAQPGSQLTWPIVLNGGTGPYAISVDWGDGTPSELLSESSTGSFNIVHTYQVSGVYKVIVKATDKNGETAFLQLVGQATGAILQSTGSTKNSNSSIIVVTKLIIWPCIVIIPLIVVGFWAGNRHHARTVKIRAQKYAAAAKAANSLDTKP